MEPITLDNVDPLRRLAPACSNPDCALLVAEHEELKRLLNETIAVGGETGAAAKLVEERLTPHFVNEEEYALPSLTLLPDLAQGKTLNNASEMIRRSERMKNELPQMLNEHRSIVIALDQLAQAARKENKESALEFTEKLRLHARLEEEILYPAGIVAGECAKLHLQQGDRLVDAPTVDQHRDAAE